jgi:hypothetical protein
MFEKGNAIRRRGWVEFRADIINEPVACLCDLKRE